MSSTISDVLEFIVGRNSARGTFLYAYPHACKSMSTLCSTSTIGANDIGGNVTIILLTIVPGEVDSLFLPHGRYKENIAVFISVVSLGLLLISS
eukprot:c53671_g1_i1 orf=617-898(+)